MRGVLKALTQGMGFNQSLLYICFHVGFVVYALAIYFWGNEMSYIIETGVVLNDITQSGYYRKTVTSPAYVKNSQYSVSNVIWIKTDLKGYHCKIMIRMVVAVTISLYDLKLTCLHEAIFTCLLPLFLLVYDKQQVGDLEKIWTIDQHTVQSCSPLHAIFTFVNGIYKKWL